MYINLYQMGEELYYVMSLSLISLSQDILYIIKVMRNHKMEFHTVWNLVNTGFLLCFDFHDYREAMPWEQMQQTKDKYWSFGKHANSDFPMSSMVDVSSDLQGFISTQGRFSVVLKLCSILFLCMSNSLECFWIFVVMKLGCLHMVLP